MAWVTPITAVTGDVVTAAWWNQDIRDNPQYLYNNRLPTTGGTLTGAVLSSGATNLGSTAAPFGTVYANAFTSTGGLTVGAAIASTNAPNIGSTSAPFGTVYANAFTSTGGVTVGAAIQSTEAPNIGSTSARFGTAYVAGLNASSNVLGDNITTMDVHRLMDY